MSEVGKAISELLRSKIFWAALLFYALGITTAVLATYLASSIGISYLALIVPTVLCNTIGSALFIVASVRVAMKLKMQREELSYV